jgi:hypothetical protein
MLNSEKFLNQNESLSIESALLTSEEKFLTRLTISSLRLLQLIAQDFNISSDNLTPEQIIHWMEEDSKIKREQGQDNGKLSW